MLYSFIRFAIHGLECMMVMALALGQEKQVDESLRHAKIGDGNDKSRRWRDGECDASGWLASHADFDVREI